MSTCVDEKSLAHSGPELAPAQAQGVAALHLHLLREVLQLLHVHWEAIHHNCTALTVSNRMKMEWSGIPYDDDVGGRDDFE